MKLPPPPPPRKKYSILYADDHHLIREALCKQIDLFDDFKVVKQCCNGQEVIQYLEAYQQPDIIMVDLQMPVMDGYATIQWVKENSPAIKVLVATIFDYEAARAISRNYGADNFIAKTADITQVEIALHNLISCEANTAYIADHFLTSKELKFLQLICKEIKMTEIAAQLFISVSAAEKLNQQLLTRFNVTTRASLARYARLNGIVL